MHMLLVFINLYLRVFNINNLNKNTAISDIYPAVI